MRATNACEDETCPVLLRMVLTLQAGGSWEHDARRGWQLVIGALGAGCLRDPATARRWNCANSLELGVVYAARGLLDDLAREGVGDYLRGVDLVEALLSSGTNSREQPQFKGQHVRPGFFSWLASQPWVPPRAAANALAQVARLCARPAPPSAGDISLERLLALAAEGLGALAGHTQWGATRIAWIAAVVRTPARPAPAI